MTDHLDHAHLDLARGPQMQLVPAPHFHALARWIGSLPARVRLTMGTRLTALKARSIFATRSALPRLARDCGAHLYAVEMLDEGLESVFRYLVE